MKRKLRHFITNISISLLSIVIFLSLSEFVLYLIGVGGEHKLLSTIKTDAAEYLVVNKNYMNRYFTNLSLSIPTLTHAYFSKENSDDIYRVFVIGESTSQGFPYPSNNAFSAILEKMLQANFVSKKVEVINFSASASNSHTGVEVAKELAEYPPDLVMIYYGHNEFVGIGGSGTFNDLFFQINLQCSKLRTYRFLKEKLKGAMAKEDLSLFESMSEKEAVVYNSYLYRNTINDFESNYNQMVSLFKEKNVPVVAMGVVGNHRDFPPFKSEEEDLIYMNAALKDEEAFRVDCRAIASCYYKEGKGLLLNNDSILAKSSLRDACNHDLIRFRASKEINLVIQQVAKKYNIQYVDFQNIFDSRSAYGITGNDWLLEHVHPTLEGQNLIARVCFDSIKASINLKDSTVEVPLKHSLVDKIIVAIKMEKLYKTAVFRKIGYYNSIALNEVFIPGGLSAGTLTLRPDIQEEDYNVIVSLIKEKLSDDKVHVNYGIWLFNNKRFPEAYEEFSLALEQNPLNFQAINNLAIMDYKLGKTDIGIVGLKKAIAFESNEKLIYRNLFIMLQEQGMYDEAKDLKKELKERKIELLPDTYLTMAFYE